MSGDAIVLKFVVVDRITIADNLLGRPGHFLGCVKNEAVEDLGLWVVAAVKDDLALRAGGVHLSSVTTLKWCSSGRAAELARCDQRLGIC
jgi:hypothetical protein